MPRISLEDRAACVSRYAAGESATALGLAYGLSNVAVLGLVRRRNGAIRSNKESHQTHSLNHDFFGCVDNEEAAYWLGFLLADGGIYKNSITLALGQIDSEHVLRFRDAIGSNHKPFYRPRIAGKSNGTVGLTMRSDAMVADLARYGVVPCKSKTAQPAVLHPNVQKHFWRGVIDGDGSISAKPGRWSVRLVGSQSVCEGFAKWILAACLVPSTVSPHKGIWQARVEGLRRSWLVVDALYNDAAVYLPRKRERALTITTAARNISRLGARHGAERGAN